MVATYLLMLVGGLSVIALGMTLVEEIHRLAAMLTGAMLLVAAFILAPAAVQVGVGVILLIFLQRLHRAAQARL
ncbi:MAG: hypothetical protein KME64_05000 [Scytonematopsis contorta HA4267-MV1]|jgi:hypothetical protein|nr:hypothetical protein [Scytonematopsis contorta HA4267-MV1]